MEFLGSIPGPRLTLAPTHYPEANVRVLLPPDGMPLTSVPGIESRAENKHNLKSGQGDEMEREGKEPALHLSPLALWFAPLVGHKAPPAGSLDHCVPAPFLLQLSPGPQSVGTHWVPCGWYLEDSRSPRTRDHFKHPSPTS